jgi:hypothetical protein
MKEIISLFLALTMAGCMSAPPRPDVSAHEEIRAVADVPRISPTDQSVLRLVISDWSADPESEGEVWPVRTNGTLMVFTPTVGFTYAVQIEMDVRPRVIPEDVIASFTNRNAQTFDISSVSPIGDRVRIVDRYERYWIDFEKTYPEAKGYAAISVPGYSPGGDQALVRLSGGPSYHGFTCTYFLERKRDGWVIKWKESAHYL